MAKIEGHNERNRGSEGDALLNFKEVLGSGQRILRAIGVDFEAVTGWGAFSGNTTTGFRYAMYFQPETDGDAHLLGLGVTEIIKSGATIDRAQDGQFHIIVQSGATVLTRGGDPNAGLHPLHAKIQGDVGATWNSGHRVAPVWSDIQINGVDVSGEEVYHFLASAGGSRARALIRHESQIAQRFLQTDKGAGNGFIVASGYETTQSNDPSGFFVVDLNGTLVGIPYMAAS